jgi:hypothetical protein
MMVRHRQSGLLWTVALVGWGALSLGACDVEGMYAPIGTPWHYRDADVVSPTTTIARVPIAKTYKLEAWKGPDRGCVLHADGTRAGAGVIPNDVRFLRLCFPGLRGQFDASLEAMLQNLLTPAETPDYVARMKVFDLRSATVYENRTSVYYYTLDWGFELVDRDANVVVAVKDTTRSRSRVDRAKDEDAQDALEVVEREMLDRIRGALLASSVFQLSQEPTHPAL